MTDDANLTAVDERGARAGATRIALAAGRPAPAFDPDLVRIGLDDGVATIGGRRGRRVLALVGAAAAILVLVAAAAVLARGGEDDSAPTDEVDGGVRPGAYVIDRGPEGLELLTLLEPVPPGQQQVHHEVPPIWSASGPAVLSGPEDGPPGLAAVALRHSDRGIDTGGPGPDTPPEANGMEPVDVGGGRRAWAPPVGEDGPLQLVVEAGDGIAGLFRSGSSDPAGPGGSPTEDPRLDAVLRDAARTVEVDGDRATVAPSGLPPGWVEQGQVDAEHVLPSTGARSLGLLAADGAWVSAYGLAPGNDDAPDPDAEPEPVMAVTVSVLPGHALDVRARQFAARTYDEVEVQGHPGVLVEVVHGGEHPWTELSVTWLEAPGVLIDVFGTNVAPEELLAVAERLRPATSAEVDDARARILDGYLAEAAEDGVVLGRGRFSDGRFWGLVGGRDEDGSETVELLAPGPPGSWGCAAQHGTQVDDGPDAPVVGETCLGTTGDLTAGYGRLRADVAEVAIVDIEAVGGATEVDRVPALAVDGVVGFAVELPEDHRYRVIAYDDAGDEIGRARLGP